MPVLSHFLSNVRFKSCGCLKLVGVNPGLQVAPKKILGRLSQAILVALPNPQNRKQQDQEKPPFITTSQIHCGSFYVCGRTIWFKPHVGQAHSTVTVSILSKLNSANSYRISHGKLWKVRQNTQKCVSTFNTDGSHFTLIRTSDLSFKPSQLFWKEMG